jgi:hypothetical protein
MKTFVAALCIVGWATTASAQQRPLVTEDPETIGPGLVLIESGVDVQMDIFYPLSGLTGDLLRVAPFGVSFGLGAFAELQLDGGFYDRFDVNESEPAPFSDRLDFTGNVTTDVEDLVIGTKLRLVTEAPGRPAMGIRLATRLPNASNESGLGLDTMDFFASALIGKTVQSIRVVGNAGLGILSDPTQGDHQNDVLTYGVSIARAVRQGLEIVSEVNGRLHVRSEDPPAGTESRGAFRVGGRFTTGTVRVDGAMIIGFTRSDPSFGFTAGFTWVFRGFRTP